MAPLGANGITRPEEEIALESGLGGANQADAPRCVVIGAPATRGAF
jgi:hypothetical protein